MKSISQRIASLTAEKMDSLSEEAFYRSAELQDYLEGMAATLLGTKAGEITVTIADMGESGISYTDGSEITLNYKDSDITRYVRAEDRFTAFCGVFFHEIAHIKYLDFDLSRRAAQQLVNGSMFGDVPEAENAQEQEYIDEILTGLADPKIAQILLKIYHDLENICDDRHDEESIMWDYGKLTSAGIIKARESLYATFDIFDSVQEKIDQNTSGLSKIELFYNAFLEYTRFDEITMIDKTLMTRSEILKPIHELGQSIETAVWTDDLVTRYTELNKIVLKIWQFIRENINDQSGDGDGDSNDSNQNQNQSQGQNQNNPKNKPLTDQDIQNILNSLNNASQNFDNNATKNRKSSQEAKDRRKEAQNGNQQEKGNPVAAMQGQATEESEKAIQEALSYIMNSIATGEAENEVEQELASNLNVKIHAVSQNSTHKGVPVDVKRDLENYEKDTYNRIMQEVGPYSKRLQKQMLEALKDLREGNITKHRPFGRIIEIQDTYRPDGLCYATKKIPKDLPNMAVSILADNSGSMSGPRIEATIKAATLLYDFATGIGVPVAVSSHSTVSAYSGEHVRYNVYTDFDKASDKDKYRIASMRAGGCNRDGCAIEIAANLLAARPEEIKLLIIISDGQPNGANYGGELAEEDIKSIVRRYHGKGVEIIAAAIGDDKETIKRIYGNNFLDISDLEKLPKTMTNIVKKRIMASL